jgi:L,D-transpeptidase YbiS
MAVRVVLPPRRWLVAAGVAAALPVVALLGTGYAYGPLPPADPGPPSAESARLRRETERIRSALARKVPRGHYVVIDRANNRLYLRRGDEMVLEAVCSAGSGMVLREAATDRSWVFDTPRGVFRVIQRTRNPVWRKPDWAFVEEAKPVPRDPAERIEYGTLGEYALHFGNGYMIHGTLYERLLGRSVTHGCIRLGREDLRRVYQASPVGTPIYVF